MNHVSLLLLLVLILLVASAIDTYLTVTHIYSISEEGNPLIRYFMSAMGTLIGLIFVKIVSTLIVTIAVAVMFQRGLYTIASYIVVTLSIVMVLASMLWLII